MRNRLLSSAAIVCVGIAVAASTVFFNVADTVFLRPLPFPIPEQLVGVLDSRSHDVSPLAYLGLRERTHSFSKAAAYMWRSFNLSTGATTEYVSGAVVTPEFFAVLQARPLRGRTFLSPEQSDENSSVIIGDDIWKSDCNGRPDIIGSRLVLDSVPYTVIGVIESDQRFPLGASIWITSGRDPVPRWPFSEDDEDLRSSTSTYLGVIGRLRPGVTAARAQADVDILSSELREHSRDDSRLWHLELLPLQQQLFGDLRKTSLALFGAGCLVLLLAAVSVANLLLAQALRTAHERAVRVALGASPGELALERFVQGCLLGTGSLLVGGALATAVVRMFRHVALPVMSKGAFLHLSSRDAAFMTCAACFGAIGAAMLGSAPAAGRDTASLIRGGHQSSGRRHVLLREALVAIQVALACPLLASSASLWKELRGLTAVKPGFEGRQVLTFKLPLPVNRARTMEAAVAFHERVRGIIQSWPETESASVTSTLPLSGMRSRSAAGPVMAGASSVDRWVELVLVSPAFFRSMGIPLLRGREFLPADDLVSAPVALVDETAAKQFWPNGDALGARVWTAPSREMSREVVGVVGAVRAAGLNTPPSSTIYLPYAQVSGAYAASWGRLMSYAVRVRGSAEGIKNAVRQLVGSVDPDQAIADLRTMDEVASRSVATRTLLAGLLGVFGGVALLLAASGIVGVVGQAVVERRTECAIRVALGATTRDLLRVTLSRTLGAVCVGLIAGLGATLVVARVLSPLFGGDVPLDAAVFVWTAMGLLLGALVTSLIAARELLRERIVEALRYG